MQLDEVRTPRIDVTVYGHENHSGTPVMAFITEVEHSLRENPELAKLASITFEVYSESAVEVVLMEIKRLRLRGYGRQLLKIVTDAADRNGVTIYLKSHTYPEENFGRKVLSTEHLDAWYQRNGFETNYAGGDDMMERKPKTS